MKYLKASADFSACGCYRWALKRSFEVSDRTILFIGLNPSKADKYNDDNTLRRLIAFSKSWKYGNLIVINLFARIAHNPQLLKRCSDPIGNENDHEIAKYAEIWSRNYSWDLWLGWGVGGMMHSRNLQVIRLLEEFLVKRTTKYQRLLGPLVLGLTAEGHPRHPLYISKKQILKPFNWKDYLFASQY